MSQFLRNRFASSKESKDTPDSSRSSTPSPNEELRLAPVSKIVGTEEHDKKYHHKPKTRKRRNGFIFFLGGIFGIVVAGFFAQRSDLIELPEFSDLNMESLMDVLPAGFVRDARDLAV